MFDIWVECQPLYTKYDQKFCWIITRTQHRTVFFAMHFCNAFLQCIFVFCRIFMSYIFMVSCLHIIFELLWKSHGHTPNGSRIDRIIWIQPRHQDAIKLSIEHKYGLQHFPVAKLIGETKVQMLRVRFFFTVPQLCETNLETISMFLFDANCDRIHQYLKSILGAQD